MEDNKPIVSHPSPAWQRAGLPPRFEKLGLKGQRQPRIGRGKHGEVVLAWDKNTQQTVAVKIGRFARPGSVAREAAAARQAAHPNVLQVLAAGEDPARRKSYLVSEYLPQGNLTNDLGAHPRAALCGVLCGLAHMHRRGVLHNDLHGGNLMLRGDTGVIIDFGSATRTHPLWVRFLVSATAEPWEACMALHGAVHRSPDPCLRRDFDAFVDGRLLRDWRRGHLPRPKDLQRTALFARLGAADAAANPGDRGGQAPTNPAN